MMTGARQMVSMRQKQVIVEKFKRQKTAGSRPLPAALAVWAKHNSKLDEVPTQSTISPILRDAAKIETAASGLNPSTMRTRPSAEPRLKDALYRWICAESNRGIILIVAFVRMKEAQLLDEANGHRHPDDRLNLQFPKGWVERFKQRDGLRFRQVHGEAMSADVEAIAKQISRIRVVMAPSASRDTWNSDEFDLLYCQPPGWTLLQGRVQSHKKDKTRLTFLACCNSKGIEKLPLMIFNSAANPGAFKKKSGCKLGFDYYANKKPWMTTTVVFAWLQRVVRRVWQQVGREFLQMVDNCTAHGTLEFPSSLQNLLAQFLPPNITSIVQPLDANIIAWSNAGYQLRILFRVFDNTDMGQKSIYNVDILTDMRWATEIWNSCPADVIENCFDHCVKIGTKKTAEKRDISHHDKFDGLVRNTREHGVKFTRASSDSMLTTNK